MVQEIVKGQPHQLALSRKTSSAESRYSVYHLELLSIYTAIAKFRHMLEGQKFEIRTDQNLLTSAFFKPKELLSNRQQHQLSSISEFCMDISLNLCICTKLITCHVGIEATVYRPVLHAEQRLKQIIFCLQLPKGPDNMSMERLKGSNPGATMTGGGSVDRSPVTDGSNTMALPGKKIWVQASQWKEHKSHGWLQANQCKEHNSHRGLQANNLRSTRVTVGSKQINGKSTRVTVGSKQINGKSTRVTVGSKQINGKSTSNMKVSRK